MDATGQSKTAAEAPELYQQVRTRILTDSDFETARVTAAAERARADLVGTSELGAIEARAASVARDFRDQAKAAGVSAKVATNSATLIEGTLVTEAANRIAEGKQPLDIEEFTRSLGLTITREAAAGQPALSQGDLEQRNDRSLVERIAANPGGFTLDPVTGEAPTEGFAVAPLKEAEVVISVDDLTEDTVNELVEHYYTIAQLIDGEVKVGGWLNEDTGLYHLDVVQIFDNLADALYTDAASRQIAVYDLGSSNEVRTEQGLEEIRQSGTYDAERFDGQRRNQEELARRFEEKRRHGQTFSQDDLLQEGQGAGESLARSTPGLNEQAPTGPLGAFNASNPNALQIKLFESADLSTLLHESGHLFVFMLVEMSRLPGASNRVQDNYGAMLDWVGAASSDDLNLTTNGEAARLKQEKLAQAFEAYLKEGKAPSTKLQAAFAQFAEWLKLVYAGIRSLGTDIDPEISFVFDRILATDAQIEEMKAINSFDPTASPSIVDLMSLEERGTSIKEKASNGPILEGCNCPKKAPCEARDALYTPRPV